MEIAKDMKKDVLITIKGTQKVGGESDVIEMMTTGRFYRKNKLYYISYEETEATGYEGCRTTLKVGPNDKVTMTRFGPSRSQLIVEQVNNEFTVSLKLFSFAMVMPSWFSNVL